LVEPSKNQNKKKKIIEKYNSTSHFYDKRYSRIQEEKYKIVLNNYGEIRRSVLDLGCGTGLFFEYLTKYLRHTDDLKYNYIGVDISWNMLKEFKLKMVKNDYFNYAPNLILSDIDFLPFRNSIFFSIFALTSFQNLPHTRNAIKESFRVSKNKALINFSILKKNLDLNSALSLFENKIKELKIIKNEKIEDILIQGTLLKD
jgi:ubiquinone/menaquinone biosynthesis C-methylase UbiE